MQFYPKQEGIRSLLWPMLALVLLAGCDGAQDEQLIAADPVPRQGSVRFVNAIPDAPQVTGALGPSNFGAYDFGQASQLGKFLVGIYNFRFAYVTPAGDIVDVVPNERVELTQEDEVSLYLIGSWAAPTLVRVDNVEIDFGIVGGGGAHLQKADVQVVHGSGDAGPLDVYLTELGADLAAATPLASVAYGDVGDLETITPETDYQLRVTTAGTTTVLFDSGQFGIEGFTRQMFLIRDYFGPGDHDFTVSRVTP